MLYKKKEILEIIDAGLLQQDIRELEKLWDLYVSKSEKNWFLEIGVRHGGMTKVSDLWGFKNGIGIDLDIKNVMVTFENNIKLLNGRSESKIIINKVKSILGNNKLDLLVIDGGHNGDDPLIDYNNYIDFVKQDGIVVFHDLFLGDCSIDKIFDKVKIDGHNVSKFLEYGTGVFQKG